MEKPFQFSLARIFVITTALAVWLGVNVHAMRSGFAPLRGIVIGIDVGALGLAVWIAWMYACVRVGAAFGSPLLGMVAAFVLPSFCAASIVILWTITFHL